MDFLIGIEGADFVMLASDCSQARSIVVMKTSKGLCLFLSRKKVFRNNFVLGRGGEEGETLSPATPHERVPESLRTVYHFAAYRPPCASS